MSFENSLESNKDSRGITSDSTNALILLFIVNLIIFYWIEGGTQGLPTINSHGFACGK